MEFKRFEKFDFSDLVKKKDLYEKLLNTDPEIINSIVYWVIEEIVSMKESIDSLNHYIDLENGYD